MNVLRRLRKIHPKRAVLLTAFGLLAATTAVAQPPPSEPPITRVSAPENLTAEPAPIERRGTLTTDVGSGTVLTVPADIERFAIGDDELATVHVLSDREVLLQGRAAGRTTVFVWLMDGRRQRYGLRVRPDLDMLQLALGELDPAIEVRFNQDATAVVLRGKVAEERIAVEANELATKLLGGDDGARLVSLLRYPETVPKSDQRLTAALTAIDPRIRLRRVQVGKRADNSKDSLILEGQVADVASLVQAVSVAELQLGGIAGTITAAVEDSARYQRFRGFASSGSGGLQALQGQESARPGLAAQLARGKVLQSASGRVLSFLTVDALPQILVSIRVMEVDRAKARQVGFDFRIDSEKLSLGNIHSPNRGGLPAQGTTPSVSDIGGSSIVGAFVDQTLAISAALDLLEQKSLARAMAEPNLTALSGEQATVLVGGEVPIPTTTIGDVAAVQGFFFQDFGVRLDIRPTLAPDGLIALDLSPSIVRPSAGLAVGDVPGFQVQSIQTTARVAPGHSLVLGGLLSFEENLEQRGVPGLSQVPGIKHAFRWKRRSVEERELLFIITPRVLPEPKIDPSRTSWPQIEPLDPEQPIDLPELEWDDKTRWKDEAVPPTLEDNGLPPSFVVETSTTE